MEKGSSERTGTARPRSNRRNQRENILATAKQLFWSKGYSETSLDDIAQKGSVNRASIYYHFKKKTEILYAISINSIQELIDRTTPVVASDMPAEQKLEQFIAIHLKWELNHSRPSLTGSEYKRHMPPKLFRAYVTKRDQYEALFREVLKELGCVDPQDTKLKSHLALSMLNSVRSWYKPRGRLGPGRLATVISATLLNGMTLDGRSSSRNPLCASGRQMAPKGHQVRKSVRVRAQK